jgi:hypothetical protein
MQNEIRSHISDPEILEKLYRDDKKAFKAAFEQVYPAMEQTEAARFWKARLDYEGRPETVRSFRLAEIISVIAICLFIAFLIRIPAIFHLSGPDAFYQRYVSLIVFLGISLYTVWSKKIREPKKLVFTALAFLIPSLYVSFLTVSGGGDAVILSLIHLPLLMWFVYGAVFTSWELNDRDKSMGFLRHNGDLAIMYILFAISGGILTGITIALFASIGISIEKLYTENILVSGAVAAPVVASFFIEKIPSLVSKIASVIAGIFSPLVLITLLVFLGSVIVTGKDPYNDRDFLLIFNGILLGVMGIIIFSVSETSALTDRKFGSYILLMLSVITVIVDLVALSAIFYRLGEFGLTPNRLAVLVSNLLVLINLVLIMTDLFRICFRGREFRSVEMTVAKFLPVYLFWIIIVVFTFPLIFGVN